MAPRLKKRRFREKKTFLKRKRLYLQASRDEEKRRLRRLRRFFLFRIFDPQKKREKRERLEGGGKRLKRL